MKKSSIAFLVLGHRNHEYLLDEVAQRNTWASDLSNSRIRVFWLYGNESLKAPLVDEQASKIEIPVRDEFENILVKTVNGIRFVRDIFNPDYIIRTNTSSYFFISKLERYIQSHLAGRKKSFGGHHERYSGTLKNFVVSNYSFVNGAGIFLPREAQEVLSECDAGNYFGTPDDVAISYHLKQHGFESVEMTRNNLCHHHLFIPRTQVRVKGWTNRSLTRERMYLIDRYARTSLVLKPSLWAMIEWRELRAVQDLRVSGLRRYLRRWVRVRRSK